MDFLPRDSALRQAAIRQVLALQRHYAGAIPWAAIDAGFAFEGGTHPLSSKAEGIFKPAGHPAALSIKTTMPRPGRPTNPYADELASSEGLMAYSYKDRGGPDNPWNQSLRFAMLHRLPLIYFWALRPGVYAAVVPVFVVEDRKNAATFGIAPGAVLGATELPTHLHAVMTSAPEKAYVSRIVRERLHQRAFRELVLDAYDHRCAMCSIKFDEFLQAAHILPDRDERGKPEVQNGLALCSLHHEAYDRFLVDVDTTYTIRLSPELRARRDGPIFQAAFLERDGQRITLPRSPQLHPSPHYIEARLHPR